jgi:predicted nucleic acid-binding protein
MVANVVHDKCPVVVLDTNVVLDLFVFRDPAFQALWVALQAGQWRWLGTSAMRDELVRVLGYPNIAAWMTRTGTLLAQVLSAVDDGMTIVQVPAPAPLHCRDPDDQKFIDLAWAYPGLLLSKDHEVLRLTRGLHARGTTVSAIFPIKP